MALITRQGKGSRLTIQEMDGNLLYLENLTGSLELRIDSLEEESGSVRSDFNEFTSSFNTGSFTGSFEGGFVSQENLLPKETDVIDLGSPTKRWRDLYLSGSSIFLGNLILQEEGGKLQINDDQGNSVDLEGTAQTASFVEFDNIGNKPTLISGSSQVSFTDISDKPTLVSGSSQIAIEDATGFFTFSSSLSASDAIQDDRLNSLETFSSSLDDEFATDAELSAASSAFDSTINSLTTADVTEDTEFKYYTDERVKIKLDTDGVISGSSQISFTDISDKPTLISGSSQVSFTDISDKPTLVSGSEQIDISDISGDTFPSRSFTFLDNLTVTGNLSILGTEFISNTETVEIEDNLLIINKGEEGAGVTNGIAGLEIDRGTETNFQLVFNETTDDFEVGEVGDLQSVATRQTSPTSAGIPFWNNSQKRFDNSSNATLNSAGTLTASSFVGPLTGNATTATTLQTARTIGGVSFNGSANINLPGVNTAGNQNTTGSAATLTTARTIGGVSFNGSANINLPGVNTAGNQNTTGSAATLTTARTIGGVSFNGSANINLPGVNTAGNQNTTGNASTATTATNLSRSVVAGNGLTGGGQLNADRTLTVGAGSGISVAASAVAVDSTVIRTTGNQNLGGVKTFTTRMRVTGTSKSAGCFYAGTSNPTNTTRLNFDGNLHVNQLNAVGEVTAFSDLQLKDNIEVITDPISKIQNIRGVTFTRTDQEDKERIHMGVIAQEVEKYFPEVVFEDSNGVKSVNYGAMAGAFIEAIKELTKRVEQLESRK